LRSIPLYEVPDIQYLLKSFDPATDDWTTFINDMTNAYNASISSPSASAKSFERKNQFLDHQLARYAHSFSDYEDVVKTIPSYDFDYQIIVDKTNYLRDFPKISKKRGKGFDYKKLKPDGSPDVWDTENISGLAMNICRRLGFGSCTRHNLYNPLADYFEIYDEVDTDNIPEWRYRLLDYDGNILLSSSTKYLTPAELWAEIEENLKYIPKRHHYQIHTASNGTFYFNLVNEEGDVIARKIHYFATIEEAEAAINEVILFATTNYSGEGLYLIEHVLLRPKIKREDLVASDALLVVPEIVSEITDEDKTPKKCGAVSTDTPIVPEDNSNVINFPLTDPYSFVITIIFPSGYRRDFSDNLSERIPSVGGERFRNIEFRRLITKILREEAPATVFIHEFYLDINTVLDTDDTPSLNNVQEKYKIWLETNADPSSTEGARLLAQRAWVRVLNQIHLNND